MIFLTGLATAWAACAEATTNADLGAQLDEAMEAYAELDRTRFEAVLRRIKADVECLEEVIERENAAALHRATALSAFLARDEDLAGQRFAAARRIDPQFDFDEAVVPVGNPVRDLYDAFDIGDAPIEPLPEPAEGEILLDGEPTLDRRPLLPTVFQRVDPDQVLQVSMLLNPGAAPPAYRALPPEPTATVGKKGPMVPLLVAAGALGVGAIGTSIGAAFSRKGYTRHIDDGPQGDTNAFFKTADRKRSTTNALSVTSLGFGVAAVGVGTAGVITGVF